MACPPSVRTSFQEGPEELDRLKTSLLEELNAAVGLTGKITWLGVHGQGGIGKTVLTIALAKDEEVRRAFPDGGLYSSPTCLTSFSLSR